MPSLLPSFPFPAFPINLSFYGVSLAAPLSRSFLLSCFSAPSDLKPQNLFLNSKGDLLIGDFGIAKMLDSTHGCAKTTIGTPYYFSPELCQVGRDDAVYCPPLLLLPLSLRCLLFLLTLCYHRCLRCLIM